MLCNGGPGLCDYLEPVAKMLDDRFRVIRWEMRGCGRSPAQQRYTLAQTLADIETLRRHYAVKRWAAVLGHSWGAELALLYALEHPDQVQTVIGLAGGVIHRDRQWSEAYRQGRAEGRDPEPDYKYPPNGQVNSALNVEWRETVRAPEFLRRLADLPIPSLFIAGGRDVRPHWPIAQTAALLPQGQFTLLEEAPHFLWFTHEKEVRKLLREWLRT